MAYGIETTKLLRVAEMKTLNELGTKRAQLTSGTLFKPNPLTEYSISDNQDVSEKKEGQVIVVTSSNSSENPEFTVTMTTEYMNHLEKSVQSLQAKVKELEELPGNLKLYEAIKQEGSSPVLDMFQILNLQKRMDAVDLSIEKLASMLETAAKGFPSPTFEENGGLEDLGRRVKALEDQFGKRGSKMSRGSKGLIKKVGPTSSKEIAKESKEFEGEDDDIATSIQNLKKEIEAIKEVLFKNESVFATDDRRESTVENQPVEIRIKGVENKQAEFIDQLNSLDYGFSRLLNTLQGRVEDLERDVGELLEKIHMMPIGGEMGDTTNIDSIQKQLKSMESDFENIMENVKKLTDERAAKEHAIDVLIEQIELLKTVKADREDLEDALADKADACQINRKVSYEQFDQACGDINKNLEEALAKLAQQETLWTQTLTSIQGEVGSKMDKNELTPLREFINNKLKSLQEKFKALSAMKKEQEAAGTKTRFLRNVNCISCDKDVVMRRDVDSSMYPKPYSLPPTKSVGPYLAYELDQLRKQQKCIPSNKNINMFENALQSSRSAKSTDHICNRYCGGSHTVTTPHQRVTRLGHFIEQWGPEIAPAVDSQVRGTDGKLYKARDDAHLKKLAAEKPPISHAESAAPAMIISGDPPTTKKSSSQIDKSEASHHSQFSLKDEAFPSVTNLAHNEEDLGTDPQKE
ncbi:rho-associated protein kinase 1-like [Diorhabda sublineata]|uniref:rho-associated protein kinase 1-like n=1 Tax=Diorhabda sublineata TaxID=1163346 RepID=UPI0024E05F0E|nr:rho-associated protein kinase 1-like [Diorhabda sublineata]